MPKTLLQGKDDLSGVLKPVSIQGKIYCYSELSAPWALSFPKKDDALFHLFEKGKCFLMHANEEKAVTVDQGDLVIFPNGLAHVLADSPDTSAVSFLKLIRGLKDPTSVVRYGGGGEQTRLMCGTFELETGKDNALLRVLPEVMHIRASSLSYKWLMAAIDLLAQEARNYGNGSTLIVSGLINIIFVQAVRVWVQSHPENQNGFLGALRDRRIAAAVAAIHNQPQKDWDLRSLAKIAGMSRSSFAQHFSSLVGQPPLSYVTNRRMQIAAQLLRKHVNMSVNKVSEQVGYFSDHAFSKAFKRYHGVTPSQFRTQ
jgi:AraC-like DNA-binding protein